MQESRAGRNLSQDCRKQHTSLDLLHRWISFLLIGIVALGGCKNTSVDDIELNLKQLPPHNGVPQFEGTVLNTGKSEIDKVFVRIMIYNMSITPKELSNSKLMAFRSIKNLKPGESRNVTIPLSIDSFCLAEFPKNYKGEEYTVYLGEHYWWNIKALDQTSFDILSKQLHCKTWKPS
ncbi:hypothetical protein NDI38_00755 [Stenomitos frigidus AS-A4]|uniref:CARDB domain-containing protein n=1 Tax=Stenomitos frigidus AS-A4 TaxID=2933935 RepID=A0ABV0KCH9_9CYAN|nr:hypothetical protein [Phormidium sp. FACHB-592]